MLRCFDIFLFDCFHFLIKLFLLLCLLFISSYLSYLLFLSLSLNTSDLFIHFLDLFLHSFTIDACGGILLYSDCDFFNYFLHFLLELSSTITFLLAMGIDNLMKPIDFTFLSGKNFLSLTLLHAEISQLRL